MRADPASLDRHLSTVLSTLKRGELVPFLGAGANLCGRPAHAIPWTEGQREYLPSGSELTQYLTEAFDLRVMADGDLIEVAQAISIDRGSGPLYASLRKLFNADWPATPLHTLMAKLPRFLNMSGWAPLRVIVTTNYDDVLERAFQAAQTEIDVVTYMARGRHEGLFFHTPPGGSGAPITQANTFYLPVNDEGQLLRPVVLKLHGAVDRSGPASDSFVISEDDYITYLSRFDVSKLLPVQIYDVLGWSNFLFLGYSLRDWNVRAILHHIWDTQQGREYESWAVQRDPDELERKSWQRKHVEMITASLDEYVAALDGALDDAAPDEGSRRAG